MITLFFAFSCPDNSDFPGRSAARAVFDPSRGKVDWTPEEAGSEFRNLARKGLDRADRIMEDGRYAQARFGRL